MTAAEHLEGLRAIIARQRAELDAVTPDAMRFQAIIEGRWTVGPGLLLGSTVVKTKAGSFTHFDPRKTVDAAFAAHLPPTPAAP